MSNLCMTSYVIEGSKSSIKALHNQFRKVLATDRSEFADQRGTYLPQSSWLGYVVKDILLLEPDKDNVCCRGSICYLDDKITIDGFQFLMEDGGWLLIRFSGTEPIIRVYCETTRQDRVQAILEDGMRLAGLL